MEEIRIYHSFKRSFYPILGCIALLVLGIILFNDEKNKYIGLFGIIFFALCLLVLVIPFIKEKVSGLPYLLISDKGFQCNHKKSIDYSFSEIDSFALVEYRGVPMLGINYISEVEQQKLETAGKADRYVRKFNKGEFQSQELIGVTNLSMDAKEILQLMNERLAAFKNQI